MFFILLQSNFASNGSRSVLTFSPTSPRDYGTVYCFANNEVGRQREACVFHVVPAGEMEGTIFLKRGKTTLVVRGGEISCAVGAMCAV